METVKFVIMCLLLLFVLNYGINIKKFINDIKKYIKEWKGSMASVRQQKEIRKHIEEIRTLTKKVMPIVLVLETEEELKLYEKIKKTMRNVSNIEFEICKK